MPRTSHPPNGKDSRPPIRSLEELVAAPAVDTPDGLLSEAGAKRRELGQRLLEEGA